MDELEGLMRILVIVTNRIHKNWYLTNKDMKEIGTQCQQINKDVEMRK